jgi:nucleoid-associated protein YgaU
MARRIVKREFDPTQPVFVKKPLRDGGVLLPEGHPFEWRRKSLTVRRVANLFNAGHLCHAEETVDMSEPEKTPEELAAEEAAAAKAAADAKAAEEAAAAKAAEEAAAAKAAETKPAEPAKTEKK